MAKIRELVRADIPEILNMLSALDAIATTGESSESARQILEKPHAKGTIYVAEDGSGVAGVVSFIAEPLFAQGGYIRLLAVRTDMRRKGIGRQLMGFAERKVFGRARNIYLCVSALNEPAKQFFEKLGYAKIGEIPDLNTTGECEWLLRKPDAGSRRRKGGRRR